MEAFLLFIGEHFLAIIFGLISAGALAYCKFVHNKIKAYKAILAEKKENDFMEKIDAKIEPIEHELEELRKYIREVGSVEKTHMDLIISSYRFRLVQLCKNFIKQGYMTPDQYEQLTEFYKLYSALGGNGQAKEYYNSAIKLDISHMDNFLSIY